MKREITVQFDVAMDAEQKKLKNTKRVKFTLTFPEGCEDQVQADAVAHAVVKYQAQIRSNWEKFEADGVPETVEYGQPLYAKRVVTRKPTEQDIVSYVQMLTQEGLMHLATTGKMPTKEENPEMFKADESAN